METQFMGETMTTTHMIERDPALYHEIWHEAWREAWRTTQVGLDRVVDAAYLLIDLMNDIIPDKKETLALREALKGGGYG